MNRGHRFVEERGALGIAIEILEDRHALATIEGRIARES
jgi:hypothetical protein